MERKARGDGHASRVTADLPPSEFALLKAARSRDKATTTDITRALLRIQAQDPDIAERIGEEIAAMRIEKAQADLEDKRAQRRAKSKKAKPEGAFAA